MAITVIQLPQQQDFASGFGSGFAGGAQSGVAAAQKRRLLEFELQRREEADIRARDQQAAILEQAAIGAESRAETVRSGRISEVEERIIALFGGRPATQQDLGPETGPESGFIEQGTATPEQIQRAGLKARGVDLRPKITGIGRGGAISTDVFGQQTTIEPTISPDDTPPNKVWEIQRKDATGKWGRVTEGVGANDFERRSNAAETMASMDDKANLRLREVRSEQGARALDIQVEDGKLFEAVDKDGNKIMMVFKGGIARPVKQPGEVKGTTEDVITQPVSHMQIAVNLMAKGEPVSEEQWAAALTERQVNPQTASTLSVNLGQLNAQEQQALMGDIGLMTLRLQSEPIEKIFAQENAAIASLPLPDRPAAKKHLEDVMRGSLTKDNGAAFFGDNAEGMSIEQQGDRLEEALRSIGAGTIGDNIFSGAALEVSPDEQIKLDATTTAAQTKSVQPLRGKVQAPAFRFMQGLMTDKPSLTQDDIDSLIDMVQSSDAARFSQIRDLGDEAAVINFLRNLKPKA